MLPVSPKCSSFPFTGPICTYFPTNLFTFFLRNIPATKFGMKSLIAKSSDIVMIIVAAITMIASTSFVSPNCCRIMNNVIV